MSWLDKFLIALNLVQSAGSPAPQRPTINFIGATVADDEARNVTNVTVSGNLQVANIVDFGGNGNGTADNTAAMAAAIIALAPDGVVYFPPGTYRFTTTQEWDANVWFGHGSAITVDALATVTINGSVDANEYQDIFKGSGTVLLRRATLVSICWFGADPASTLDSTLAARAAVASIFTGINTADGPLNAVVYAPPGQYLITKPIAMVGGGVTFTGEGRFSSGVRMASAGPAFVISSNTACNQHLNDYDSTLASADVGDAQHHWQMRQYGQAWSLDGLGQWSMDLIVKTSTTQAGLTYLVSSSGNGPDNNVNHSAFNIAALTTGGTNTTSNLGIAFTLKTSAGVVTAQTNAPALPTDGTWHHFRFDYDGSFMRVFVDGVAATLTNADTKIAQTGTIVQDPSEGVLMGQGLGNGIASTDSVYDCPLGQRWACCRMGHVSRGSSNFTPPSGKYTWDSSTNFLVNFDIIDNVGGLLYAQTRTTTGGQVDAWIPNIVGGNQIALCAVLDLQIDTVAGPTIEAIATPRSSFRDLYCRGQSGVLLHSNTYFSDITNVVLVGAGDVTYWGLGIKLADASNFVTLNGVSAAAYTINIYSSCIFNACGANYWVNASYATVYLDSPYQAELSGSCFTSDEGSPFHCTMGVVLKGPGCVRFSGFLFGLQSFNDSYQVVIDSSKRPVTEDTESRVIFDHCTFATNVSVVDAIQVRHTLAKDSIVIDDCMQGITDGVSALQPFFDADSTSLARLTIRQRELKRLPITLADADHTLSYDDWCSGKLVFSGTLTADRNIIVPTLDNYTREIENTTTHALLVKTASGSGVYVPPGLTAGVSCDGTNVILDWLQGAPVQLINAGTSSTASPWAVIVGVDVGTAYNLTGPHGTVAGQTFVAKDNSGAAGTNHITLTAPAGQTYDGAATATIATNYGRVSMAYDGVSNWMT